MRGGICLDPGGPGDAEPVARSAAGGELAGLDPVVDDAGAAAEPAGGLGDGDLAGGVGAGCGDLVGVADPLDRVDIERPAVAGGQPGGVQLFGQLAVRRDRAEAGPARPPMWGCAWRYRDARRGRG